MSRASVLVLALGVATATCGRAREDVAPFEADTSASEGGGANTSAGTGEDPSEESGGGAGEGETAAGETAAGETDAETSSSTAGDGDGDGEPGSVEQLELAYGADLAQTLDLYRMQPGPREGAAAVLLAHGGLWQGGDKSSLAALCEAIVEGSNGAIACASVNYRLSTALGGSCRGVGIDTYRDQLDDLARAYALLIEQAGGLGLDPARVHVGGHSAGGHLGHALNLRWSELSGACAGFGGCPAPAGAIGFEGIYDVAAWHEYDASFWNGQFACATRRAFGGPPGGGEVCIDGFHQLPCWDVGSPTYLANSAQALALAPVGDALIIHSPDDDWVDIAEATNFGAAMAAAFADLNVFSVTDGSCGAGSHEGVLYDPALGNCIVNFVSSDGAQY